jgi:hypothetical protein
MVSLYLHDAGSLSGQWKKWRCVQWVLDDLLDSHIMLFSRYIAQERLASFFCWLAGDFLYALPVEGYSTYGGSQVLAIPSALPVQYEGFLQNRMVPSYEHSSYLLVALLPGFLPPVSFFAYLEGESGSLAPQIGRKAANKGAAGAGVASDHALLRAG